jgi:two-component system NtrC family sensor kinase
MRRLIVTLLGGRLRAVLIASFSLVAALTVSLNALVIARVIENYLTDAESERVDRDMDLAESFYRLKLDEVAGLGQRIARDPQVVENHPAARQGQAAALTAIDEVITRKIAVPTLGGTHLVLALDADGDIVVGRVLTPVGELSQPITAGNWSSLPILADAMSSGQGRAATEIIPAELLADVGLERQAYIPLLDIPLAAPQPFDPREGTAGLALVSVYPLRNGGEHAGGAVLAAYVFNNDFTLVDRIKAAGSIDTVTIFFGDLRVSTNVMTEAGERAVGTRISEAVGDVVLKEGRDYVGRAYVVTDWYITRYEPLRDFRGEVVGSLYVGAREATFQALVHAFNNRVGLTALICILLAGIVAVPIARVITQPVASLVEANRKLAQGDMTVRVETTGGGELGALERSFNAMVETLHRNEQELLHKERLASMGQLAAGVAHEINNPLGTILLLASAMSKEARDDEPWREDLEMIVAESTRCKGIVSALLNFARQQQVVAQEVDVHELLNRVLEGLSRQPSFERIQVVRQFSASRLTLQGEPDQLKQVFLNLFVNAADAMQDGGVLTVATRAADNDWVEIEVSDTGVGVPEENQSRLFTPFFTTKAPGRGTGLGLSIVYGIIKMHRGQISVQSALGQGTTFTVRLPVRLPQVDPNGHRAATELIA